MSDKTTDENQRWWEPKRRPESGSDQHNPGFKQQNHESDGHNPGQSDYQRKFNERRRGLQGAESAGTEAGDSTYQPEYLRDQEEGLTGPTIPNYSQMSRGEKRSNKLFNRDVLSRMMTGKNMRKGGALFGLTALIIGGGGILSLLFSPSLAIIHMKEVLTDSLNDQAHALDERSGMLLRSKLKNLTNGSCGAVKIKCRFATMSDNQAKKFENAGVQIERDASGSILPNRGQITKMTFTDDNGAKTVITSTEELQSAMLENIPFRSAMTKGYNPIFAGFTDKIALNVLRLLKVSKRPVATGDTDEERQNKVNEAVTGVEDSGAEPLTKTKDENGNDVYKDADGNMYTQAEVDAAQAQGARIENYSKTGGMDGVMSSAVKGVAIQATADSACTVYNSLRFVSALSKLKKEAQAARFAMAMVLTPADSIKAGDANPDDISFVGNNLTSIRPEGTVLDDSKLADPGSAAKPATIPDPEAGKNAFDSPGYKIAADGDTPDLSLRASKFMVSGGSTSMFNKVLQGIATVVNGGNPDPKQVSAKCKYIQHPAVRFTALAVGIIAGIGSFGLTTALTIGGSVAVAMALPYIESDAADILTGDVFKNISGIDSGDAAYVGSAGIMGTMAQERGMKPLNKEEGLKELAENKETIQKYDETQSYLARATPFDINNPFSFAGSIVSSLVPFAQQSKSSASMAMMNMASLIPFSFGKLLQPAGAGAVSATYFDKCNDQGYASIGVACGPFGELRYGLSDEELNMDPEDNAQWMADTGNIDPNSESGAAKDNGQSWNFVKFLKQCANRTTPYGEYQDEAEGDGSNCVDPANEDLNKHFRVYYFDTTVDASLDGNEASAGLPGAAGSPNGETGAVSAAGWAFPAKSDSVIAKGYSSNGVLAHRGLDIADKNPSDTLGEPVFAAYSGVVKAVGPAEGYGNWIVIEHQVNSKTMDTVYGGLDMNGMLVHLNDQVQAGQEIGKIGESPDSSPPHLYFELWDGSPLDGGGQQIDPTATINAARGQAGASNA